MAEEAVMDCPRCRVELKPEQHRGIEVDRCPKCEGMWLDYHELDQLEDTVMDDDPAKGTMMMRSFGGDLSCPRCAGQMKWFRYRRYDLEIDFCEAEHGFWLDKGEEKKVLDIMRQRIHDLKRSTTAQQEWDKFLGNMGGKSFLGKVKDLFRK